MPQAWHVGSDLLCLEGQVRRHGCFRCEAAEGLGGRECQAEAALGGGDAGSGGVEGPFVPKVVTPVARREAIAILMDVHEMSERRACKITGADRSSVRYRHRRREDAELRVRLRTLAGERRRFGYRRLHVLLRREGYVLNRKKTQRLYREEGLSERTEI